MTERFAMYNMFLGLRAATQSSDPACAMAVLEATRTGAAAWNAGHEDPDITADLMLLDQYRGNLGETYAGDEPSPIATCPVAGDPYGPPPVDGDPIDEEPPVNTYPHHALACSAGGAAGGLPIALVGLGLALRRRRRRS